MDVTSDVTCLKHDKYIKIKLDYSTSWLLPYKSGIKFLGILEEAVLMNQSYSNPTIINFLVDTGKLEITVISAHAIKRKITEEMLEMKNESK